MKYQHLTQDEMDDVVAHNILAREKEHHDYDVNRLLHTSILAKLDADPTIPKEWPSEIAHCRSMNREELADYLTGDDYVKAVKLQHRDKIRHDLATVLASMMMVENIHSALQEQLPIGTRRDAAIKRVAIANNLS